jgi:hypothetical protein
MRERMSVCMEAHEVLAFYAVFFFGVHVTRRGKRDGMGHVCRD